MNVSPVPRADVAPDPAVGFHPRPSDPREGVRAVEVSIRGVVQGVGFRPFVHRAALRYRIAGWVRNEAGAVRLIAQGSPPAVDRFLLALHAELPPLARIDAFEVVPVDAEPLEGFRVLRSDVAPVGRLPVSPDMAICAACEAELRDPSDRRYRYPFITCTDCGPRFTIIEAMPYDRERSTMRAFDQCPECLREYHDPSDRRYHSETNSCPSCGPTVWLETGTTDGWDAGGRARRARDERPSGWDAIAAAGRLLRDGGIVAVRGLGGFHLAVDACNGEAVQRLRERKHRDGKPLAVMVRDLTAARRIALVSRAEAEELASRERPIVVLRERSDSGLAREVAPALTSVGVMLAYTPLHHLLFEAAGDRPLVMTSGNVSDEPIVIDNDAARVHLETVADAFLLHDREIVARYDDSLVRVVGERRLMLRRSRGYAPMPITLPIAAEESILAVGPHLKNTLTLAHGSEAFVSQHVGDLENLETLQHFEDVRRRYQEVFRISPAWVVRDLHPGYLSTRMAEESGLPELPAVQHHHAHVAAVLGEHGIETRALGLAFDGTGYGDDGNVWGFEFLEADLWGYRRLAHLRYAPLPGGDRAARSPWRALLGYASIDEEPAWAHAALATVPIAEQTIVRHQLGRRLNAPLASSMGRLFDAAAAVLHIRMQCAYEGQAAMELEAKADGASAEPLPFPLLRPPGGPPQLDPVPLLRALASLRRSGADIAELAARFHETLASAAAGLALELCDERRLDRVALAGGCFQNAHLLRSVTTRLEEGGVEVLAPIQLGPNDGAISYGQAVVAAARLIH